MPIRDPRITSRVMASIKSKDTGPEILLRRSLWGRGLRYRLRSKLIGKPDIVFQSARVAIFVDGDFWHGNAWRIRNMGSFEEQFERISNGEFWRKKIEANVARDKLVTETLTKDGWTVYRVFESRLKVELSTVVSEIENLVRQPAKVCSLPPLDT
ncbi:very short patch repair endonuclease [Kitasatospora cineracea]